jgi:hypothetical protein
MKKQVSKRSYEKRNTELGTGLTRRLRVHYIRGNLQVRVNVSRDSLLLSHALRVFTDVQTRLPIAGLGHEERPGRLFIPRHVVFKYLFNISTRASCSGGPGFKSRPGDFLS